MTEVKLSFTTVESAADKALLSATQTELQRIVNLATFKSRVKDAGYSFRKCRSVPPPPVNMSNAQILEIIQNGIELGTAADNVISMRIALGAAIDIGGVDQGTSIIQINRTFFDRCRNENSPTSLGTVLLHEWMHVAGFLHDPTNNNVADVPWQVGNFAYALGAAPKFLPDGNQFNILVDVNGFQVVTWACGFESDAENPPERRGK